MYAACVGRVAAKIKNALQWASPPRDYSYQLRDPLQRDWIKYSYNCWKEFRVASIAAIDAGAAIVAITDITGYYENISHELLLSDVRALETDEQIVDLLGRCLGRWCVLNGKGIPQGLNASHLLAKLYLNVIDRSLADAGFIHRRYVDDTRIFCHETTEARKALLHLSTALRRKGLNLQSSKTEILPSSEGRLKIEGVIPTITPLAKHYLKEIAEALGIRAEYLTVSEAEAALAMKGMTIPTPLLQQAYRAHFMDDKRFEKTLFHFLLARMGANGDAFAAEHSLTLLASRPEETQWILNYLEAVGQAPVTDTPLLDCFLSPVALFPYQHYQILRWRQRASATASEEFVRYVRRLLSAPQSPAYLRSAARAFIAIHGSAADIDDIAASYSTHAGEEEQAECLLALFRMERGRRNAFLGKAKGDGMLPAAAVALVRANLNATELGLT